MGTFTCTRSLECVFQIEAGSLAEAMSLLPADPDGVAERADKIVFGDDFWDVTDGVSKMMRYDDDDVEGFREEVAKGGCFLDGGS